MSLCAAVLSWPLATTTPLSGQAPPAATLPAAYLDALPFRAIGPALVGGRIGDLAVNEANPAMFFVAAATGGLWKTVNGGVTWQVLFDDQPDVVSIGDIAIGPRDPNLVWVGTGENNNRNSSSWGNGVYKSTDGGATWARMGLEQTRHIGRIVIDPTDADVVYVAATGHLWGPNPERGVFKTTDGGRTWARVLFVDDDTGATELVMDPSNPHVLYAGLYQRRRAVWGFNGGGPGSGIYKTTDGGRTWARLGGGLPTGDIGRIGMDVYRRNPNVLYARVEHARESGVYRTDDAGATWRKMSAENPRPMYFSQIRIDPANDHRIYMLGVSLDISDDGGRTWVMNRSAMVLGVWPPGSELDSAIHSDNHAFWINPANPNHMMVGNDGGVSLSLDRGLTWRMFDNMDLGQFYHVGFDMDVPYRVYGGMQDNLSFGGPSASRSYLGTANDEWFLIGAGDGFVSFADPTDSNIVYTEWQNGSIVRVDRKTNERKTIKPTAGEGDPALRWNWNTPLIMSPHDPKTLYIGAQRVFRTRDRGHSWDAISGDLTTGADRDALPLMGVVGKNVTLAKHDGISAWPTLAVLAESPRKAGVLYAGTDDGLVHVTRDDGGTWTDVTARFPGKPKGVRVAALVASAGAEGRVYAAFDGHEQDDYGVYLYRSEDFGTTWTRTGDLPEGQVVRAVTEDRRVPDVVYVGTEFGLFVSIDRATHFTRWRANLPTVPIYGIAQHPRENDLILATHGRSIWIADDVTPIQQAADALKARAHLFDLRPARQFNRAHDRWWMVGDQKFWGRNPPFGALISYRIGQDVKSVALRLTDASGSVVRELAGDRVPSAAGVHRVTWDLRYAPTPARSDRRPEPEGELLGPAPVRSHVFQQIERAEVDPATGPFVLPGEYTVTLVVDGRDAGSRRVRVEPDWLIAISDTDRRTQHDTALALHRWQATAIQAADRLHAMTRTLARLDEQMGPANASWKTASEPVRGRLDTLRRRFGVTLPGERRTFGGAPPLDAAAASLKGQIVQSTSLPTATQMRAVEALERDLRRAIDDVNALGQAAWPQLLQGASMPTPEALPPLRVDPPPTRPR